MHAFRKPSHKFVEGKSRAVQNQAEMSSHALSVEVTSVQALNYLHPLSTLIYYCLLILGLGMFPIQLSSSLNFTCLLEQKGFHGLVRTSS